MAQAFIPSMSSDIMDIKDPTNILKYILRHYVHTPKNINDTFANQEISFTYDVAESGSNMERLVGTIEGSLVGVLSRYFVGAESLDVIVDSIDVDDKTTNVSISLNVIIGGDMYSVDEDIIVNKDGTVDFNI